MADGDSENDFWIGGHSTTLDNFFAYWLVTPGCTEINAEVSAEVQIQSRQLCSDLFSKSAFADMASVVDINEYVETCAGIVPPEGKITSDWPGCSVFAAFASAASRAGKCVDWRTDDLCSYGKCSTGASYSACGPSTPKTCDNYKTYQAISVGYGVEGCNCDAGKVKRIWLYTFKMLLGHSSITNLLIVDRSSSMANVFFHLLVQSVPMKAEYHDKTENNGITVVTVVQQQFA